jgi:hypothetical protein
MIISELVGRLWLAIYCVISRSWWLAAGADAEECPLLEAVIKQ